MRILIADDVSSARLLLEFVLKQLDHEVISACDGNEAWDILNGPDAPKLAVLDWDMPGMNGAEICKEIRESDERFSPYLILLTNKNSKEDIIEGLNAGADDYIIKPFDRDILKARIDVGIRVIQLQNALADRIQALQDAIEQIKTLQGIIPICSYCKKIRSDAESWEQMEQYIMKHSDAKFSHGICPECYEKESILK